MVFHYNIIKFKNASRVSCVVHVLPGVFVRTLNKEYRMLNAKRKHQEKALVFLNCFLIFVNQLCLPRQRFIILNAILCLTLAQDLEMTSFTIHMETISFIDTSGNYFNVRQSNKNDFYR